ncbi:unnamed protein product, partial [Musa textilis]
KPCSGTLPERIARGLSREQDFEGRGFAYERGDERHRGREKATQ